MIKELTVVGSAPQVLYVLPNIISLTGNILVAAQVTNSIQRTLVEVMCITELSSRGS